MKQLQTLKDTTSRNIQKLLDKEFTTILNSLDDDLWTKLNDYYKESNKKYQDMCEQIIVQGFDMQESEK